MITELSLVCVVKITFIGETLNVFLQQNNSWQIDSVRNGSTKDTLMYNMKHSTSYNKTII